MGVEHVNRKGDRYYLHAGTGRGKRAAKYYFSRKQPDVPVATVPEGYEVYESRVGAGAPAPRPGLARPPTGS